MRELFDQGVCVCVVEVREPPSKRWMRLVVQAEGFGLRPIERTGWSLLRGHLLPCGDRLMKQLASHAPRRYLPKAGEAGSAETDVGSTQTPRSASAVISQPVYCAMTVALQMVCWGGAQEGGGRWGWGCTACKMGGAAISTCAQPDYCAVAVELQRVVK